MFVSNRAPGLGDADTAARFHSQLPIRLAEMAQGIIAGDIPPDPSYATKEQAAIDVLNTAILQVQEMEAAGLEGGEQRVGPVTNDFGFSSTPAAIEQSYSEIAYTANLIRQAEQEAAIAKQEEALQAQAEAQFTQAATQQQQQAAQIIEQQNAQAAQQRAAEQQMLIDYQARLQADAAAQRAAIEANTARLRAENEAAQRAAQTALAQAQEAYRQQQAGMLTAAQLAQAEQERIRAQNAALAAAAAFQQYQVQTSGANQSSNGSALVSSGGSQYDPNGGTFLIPGDDRKTGQGFQAVTSPVGLTGGTLAIAAVAAWLLFR